MEMTQSDIVQPEEAQLSKRVVLEELSALTEQLADANAQRTKREQQRTVGLHKPKAIGELGIGREG